MEVFENQHYWFKDAIVYAIITEVFYDSNGDGIGDIQGIIQKLDYLCDLGIECIWLLPIYPTTGRDDGYDVVNHKEVDLRYGTLDDFKQLIDKANKRGIKVIIDLVVHHTSDAHDWFRQAKDPSSKYHNYYVWTDKIPDEPQAKSAFPGVEAGVWTYEVTAKKFYYHSFYHFEPDLNVANPEVQKEIIDIMQFWLDVGVDGFRMDAATLMFDKKGLEGTEVKDATELMRTWHEMVDSQDGVLLAEADVTAEKVPLFFGKGDRMDMMFNFLLNRYIFLAFARKSASPIDSFMRTLPLPPLDAQWLNFLRNHDELNIERLNKEEKDAVFNAFAPEEGMRVYHRGIRRRLSPMFEDNLDRLKMAYSMLFALPGAVMLLYGDELGLGDDLDLPERMSVRIPMQWDTSENGGFSSVDPSAVVRTVVKTDTMAI